MNPREPIRKGVEKRFLTAVQSPPSASGAPTRQITDKQAQKYADIGDQVIQNEARYHDTHHALYHAQDPRMRIAQDVYKRVYSRHHNTHVPEDFHFLRFPGPDDKDYDRDLPTFFGQDMAANGMIDDNISPTKTHIISTNLSAFGGLGHAGEETFHYFQTGKGQTPPPVKDMMTGYLGKFGLAPEGIDDFYEKAQELNDTPEGNLMQILVPREKLDAAAYLAHPHGIPHDDELFDRLHQTGPIRYGKLAPKAGLGPREKLNDEVTRNLKDIREVWSEKDKPVPPPGVSDVKPLKGILKRAGQQPRPIPPDAAPHVKTPHERAVLLQQARELNAEAIKRFAQGRYRPSQIMNSYVNNPAALQHPENAMQRERLETNPEHFGGQGIRSHHELMRMQNRSNYIQARLHMSRHLTLNPASGIKMIRHTTMEPEKQKAYQELVDEYVERLFRAKNTA